MNQSENTEPFLKAESRILLAGNGHQRQQHRQRIAQYPFHIRNQLTMKHKFRKCSYFSANFQPSTPFPLKSGNVVCLKEWRLDGAIFICRRRDGLKSRRSEVGSLYLPHQDPDPSARHTKAG